MVRDILIVLEIIIAAAGFVGSTITVLAGRATLASSGSLSSDKLRVILDTVVFDVIAVFMTVGAYLIYTEHSWGRWVSLVGGLVILGCASARSTLALLGARIAPVLSVLGLVVVALSIFLPSGG